MGEKYRGEAASMVAHWLDGGLKDRRNVVWPSLTLRKLMKSHPYG